MVDRPRCLNWTPLVTQQLRIRNLIQVIGHNIVCDSDAERLFYTLHATPMSAPFYRSEEMPVPRPYPEQKTVTWPEISCEKMARSASQCVCIRVWQATEKGEQRALFVWGVYFSGLVPVVRRSEARYRLNTLSFQMHGGQFASAETFDPEYATKVAFPQGLPNFSSKCNSPRSPDTNGRLSSCDETVRLRNSLSQLGVSSTNRQLLAIKSSPDLSAFLWNGSPVRSPGTPSERWLPNSIDARLLKYRYLQMGFKVNDCRPLYSVEKMLTIQERQRILKQKNDANEAEREKIIAKSVFCLDIEKATNLQLRPQQRIPGMGKQLSRLLYQQEEPVKIEDLIRAQELRREIESQTFRVKILRQAHEQQTDAVDEQRKELIKVNNENISLETRLSEIAYNTKRELENLPHQEVDHMRETLQQFNEELTTKRRTLLRHLQEIYTIRKCHNGLYTINNVPLPHAESYRNYTVSPADLSVALGFVAHAVILCSSILDIPLRNRIIHEGSVSKIEDNIKPIPPRDKIYPLYFTRNPPSNAVLYGVYLLNQNISQIKFSLELSIGDTRATLINLQDIMNGLESTKELRVSSSMDLAKVTHSMPITIVADGGGDKQSRASHSFDNNNKLLVSNAATFRQMNSAFGNTKRFGSEPALCDQGGSDTGAVSRNIINVGSSLTSSSNVSSSELLLEEISDGKNS